MQTTSHYPMRPRTVTTKRGCIRVVSQGRTEARRRAINESRRTQ